MSEEHIEIPRRARYATLGGPGEELREIWILCHGYGQLARRFLRRFTCLDDGTRWLIAPEGLSRYYVDHTTRLVGASWMTSEDRMTEIDDYVRFLDLLSERLLADTHRDAVRIVGLGFSQGAATLSRWAAHGSVRFDRMLLWGGFVPPDLDLDQHGPTLSDAALTLVVGETDEYIRDEHVERESARLDTAGVVHEVVTYPGGHDIEADALMALAGGHG